MSYLVSANGCAYTAYETARQNALAQQSLNVERFGIPPRDDQSADGPNPAQTSSKLAHLEVPAGKPSSAEPEMIDVQPLPAPRPTPVKLTIDRAINTTLIADPKIRAGFEAINQSNADLLTSSLPPNPSLFMDAQLLPLTRPFVVNDQGGPPQTDFQLGYPIDWFLFGKRAAAMASAGLGIRVSQADYADMIRLRVTETAVAFFDVLEAKAFLDLAQQDVDNLKRMEAVTRKAVAAGGRPQVDHNRVRLDLLSSQRAYRDFEFTLVAAKARLRALLGQADADPNFEVDGELAGKLSAELITAEKAYDLAVVNRPDIESDKIQIAKAEADVNVEDRKAYPQIMPTVGYTRQFQEKAIGYPDANSYMLAMNSTLPVFDRNQGNRLKARSIVAQHRYKLQMDLVNLRSEIEQATKQFLVAYQNATSVADEQLKLATEVRASINKAYESGGRPLLDVLDAQRNYRDTYRAYITGRANYWRSMYRLNAAVGKKVLP